jgi:hypothetical protein
MRNKLSHFLRLLIVFPFLVGWFICAAMVHLIYPEFSRTIWIESVAAMRRKKA